MHTHGPHTSMIKLRSKTYSLGRTEVSWANRKWDWAITGFGLLFRAWLERRWSLVRAVVRSGTVGRWFFQVPPLEVGKKGES